MPRRMHRPQIYICNNGTTRSCQAGFSTMSGLTRHQNTLHPVLNNQLRILPVQPAPPALSPPPDDMDFIDREIDRDSNHGRNDPGPHEATKAMCRYCTILSLMVHHLSALFLFIFKRVLSTTRHALWFSWKLPTTSHSSSALYHAWGRWCRT